MGQVFEETAHEDASGMKMVSVGQTRDGKEEWVTPIALWELDDATGLYMPPGASPNPRRPRVEATLTGQIVALPGDQWLVVGDTAVGLTPPAEAEYATITVEEGAIRYRLQGNDALPTDEIGHSADDGSDSIVLSSLQDIAAFRAISRDPGIEAALMATYAKVVA